MLTTPPSLAYARDAKPVASMYCAVLNQTRTVGLWRTNVSTTSAVRPAITIGHGCGKSSIEAMSGMKPTDVVTLANGNGILNENESHTIPRTAKAARAFQSRGAGRTHSGKKRRAVLARVTRPTRRRSEERRVGKECRS